MIRPAFLAILLSSPAAFGQAETRHHDDAGAIVLYEHVNYEGRSVRIDGEAPDLRWIDFNDLTSSIRVEGGRWEICLEPDYRGSCHVLDEDLPDMSEWAFNDRITSVRPVSFRGPDREAGITLYSEFDYSGRELTVLDPVDNLSRMSFNDTARSIEVHAGVWTVCVDDDYRGGCRTLDRSVSDLRRFRLDRRITSVRPGGLDEPAPPPHRPPHHQPGYPGPGHGGTGHGGTGGIEGGVAGPNTVFFAVPQVDGYPLAACLFESGYRCGQEAADAACAEAGLRRAIHFSTEHAGGQTLWYLADARPGRGRDGLTDLLCAQ